MASLTFFLREALRSLRRNAIPSFAAIATVLVTMLMLGVFIPITQATNGAANEIRSKVILDVYLAPGAKDFDVERVRQLITDTPHVRKVVFVSKEQALAQESAKHREAYALLGANPLPDTFRVTPDGAGDIASIKDHLAPVAAGGGRTVADPAIDEVKDRRDETGKIITATRIVKLTMALLTGLLVLASVLLIGNTIRLSLFARRREVEVMKLVGATDWFIRWPFMIEGMIVGSFGALLAILLLGIGKVTIIDPFKTSFALLAAPDTINFGMLIAILAFSAVAVSALGSGISLRRFLRV